MSAVGQRSALDVLLGLSLQPEGDPSNLTPEHAELMMRDLRRFSRAAWLPQVWGELNGAPKLNAGPESGFRTEAAKLIEQDDWWPVTLDSHAPAVCRRP